jgi:hypothetical protein
MPRSGPSAVHTTVRTTYAAAFVPCDVETPTHTHSIPDMLCPLVR